MKKPTPPWQQLGFSRQLLDAISQNILANRECWDGPPSVANDVEGWAACVSIWGRNAVALCALGYSMMHAPFNDPSQLYREMLRMHCYYMFGKWRENFTFCGEQMDAPSARRGLPWIDFYREAFLLALLLNDEHALSQIINWPDMDLPVDEGTDDRTEQDIAFHLYLAKQLRGDSDAGGLQQKVERGRHRRPRLLLKVARCLAERNGVDFTDSLKGYLQYYRQNELRITRADLGISIDGSILWHLGRKVGIAAAMPPPISLLVPPAVWD